MKYFPIYLLLLFPIFCFGQKVDSKKYVEAKFDNRSKIQWVKYYKGRIDDLNDISVTLGYDGKDCKGVLIYLRSGIQFELEGVIENRECYLKEIDEGNSIIGSLRGKMKGQTILGTWSSHNNSKGGTLQLEETDKEVKFPSYCGDNKWIRKYSGKLSNQEVEIILQKESINKASGLIYNKKINQTYKLIGNIDQQDNIELIARNEYGRIIQTFIGDLQQDKLSLKVKESNSKKVDLLPSAGLTIGCVEYADYMTSYDVTFPKTTNAAFNQRMNEQTDDWIKACRNRSNKVKKQNSSVKPQLRNSERGYAWCEVDFFNKNLISGFMTFSNTWTPGQKLIAYTYNLQNNSSIYLEDIFENDKDYNKYIKNYIKKEIKNYTLYKDEDFKKWIKKSEFSFFTIRNDGICFSTKFSMLYGRQSITIPYRQLEPFMKNSFIKYIKE